MTVARHGAGSRLVTVDPCSTAEAARESRWEIFLIDGAVPVEIEVEVKEGRIAVQARQSLHSAPAEVRSRLERALFNPDGLKVYCRLAPRLPVDEQFGVALLQAAADDLQSRSGASYPSYTEALPAAYTYLGQFIAHEMSNMAVLDEERAVITAPTPALDLDTLFDAGGGVPNPLQQQHWLGGVGVGSVRGGSGEGRFADLPRDAGGTSLTPDARTDGNLPLAQLHVALSRFHQVMTARHGAAARRITRRHFQSLVWSDYLRRICDPTVHADIGQNGRCLVFPGQLAGSFLVPIEFAAACFRVGHSMPRDAYREWEHGFWNARLHKMWNFTGGGGGLGLPNYLPASWRVDWAMMLGDRATPEATLNKSSELGPRLAPDMHALPARLFGIDVQAQEPTPMLAGVTLQRGRTLELPTAQNLAQHALATFGVQIPMLPAAELSLRLNGALPTAAGIALQDGVDLGAQTPLWLYCLIEAQATGGGQCLGPLASRVVAESIHAAIEASADSILPDGRTIDFTAAECISGADSFDLHGLIEISAAWEHDVQN